MIFVRQQRFGVCQICWRKGGGGGQWVRFASPQLAPTAPATTVFIAFSSVCVLMLLLSACPRVGRGAQMLQGGGGT